MDGDGFPVAVEGGGGVTWGFDEGWGWGGCGLGLLFYGFGEVGSESGVIRTCILGVALDEGTVGLDLIVDKLMLIRVLANS